ncbi:MAG TPA: LpqB family beta-propeller domain-containing protein [Candidatus Nanopelagicaceae bacterium]|nr:LpqB family beta-propeller domain-containing protein [Candidatus Nanopelagicaceae bacterium]
MRIGRIIAVGVVVLSLTGCLSHIPDSGAVSYGAEAYAPSSQDFVRTLVSPPTPNANPETLINEFLAAIAGDQGDYATSRLYLAPEARSLWRPEAGVRIYADNLQVVFAHPPRGEDTYTYSGRQVGTIDQQGHYENSPASMVLSESFSVRQVGGQWRISSLADGRALSESDVARAYRQMNIYFLNLSKHNVVPDSVYLPVNVGIATSLIRALLAGPTQWLSPAVTTAIPFATSLLAGSVPVQQGVAYVDLTLPNVPFAVADRQAMSAQIIWTLKQLAEVAAVRITLGGVPLILPGAGETQSRFAYSSFSPDVLTGDIAAYGIDDNGLIGISDLLAKPTVKEIQSNANVDIAQFSNASISLDGSTIAGITPEGSLISGPLDGPFDLRATGISNANWVAPSWDSDGNLWAVRNTPTQTQVYVIAPDGNSVPVLAQPLIGHTVQGFRISRDGSRAAFAVADSISSKLYLSRVVWLSNGMDPRVRVEAPIELPWSGGTISSVHWMDATHLIVLTAATPRSIWRVAIDGTEQVNLAGIVDPTAVAAAPGMPILASDSDGFISALIGSSWHRLGTGRFPIYPG